MSTHNDDQDISYDADWSDFPHYADWSDFPGFASSPFGTTPFNPDTVTPSAESLHTPTPTNTPADPPSTTPHTSSPTNSVATSTTPAGVPVTPTSSAFDNLPQEATSHPPRSGWRRFLYTATNGLINLGPSSADTALEALETRIRQPIKGDYRIACLSLKGGVGKTTTTVGLGSTFAELRGDRIIALDANPDLGTLGQRVPQQTSSTVRDLIEDPTISRYSDVRAHTSQAPSRLEVLASEQDPAISESFSEKDYRRAIEILQSFYNVILTDCGTGLMHDAMSGILDLAHSLVLVTSPAVDGARSAWATLDWLEAHGYRHLLTHTVVAICTNRSKNTLLPLEQVQEAFGRRCAAVHVIPFDEHLAEGGEISLDALNDSTRRAFLELAASVADGFTQTHEL